MKTSQKTIKLWTPEKVIAKSFKYHQFQHTARSIFTALEITPEQTHHARLQTNEDEQLILKEIVDKSYVFQYVPGRQHSAYATPSSSILHLTATVAFSSPLPCFHQRWSNWKEFVGIERTYARYR